MLIALLAVLGVDLIVIVAIAAFVIARNRRVRRQDGVLRGPIRVESGQLDGQEQLTVLAAGGDLLVPQAGERPMSVMRGSE